MSAADALTMALVSALEERPRASVLGLAERLAVSRPAIQDRLDRLFASGQLRVTVSVPIAGPGGVAITGLFGLTVAPRRRADAGEALACLTAAQSVQRIAGRYDFLVAADFSTPREIAAFADEHLAIIGGVRQVETMLGLTMVKSRHFGLGGDDPAVPAGPPLDEIDRRIVRHLAEDGRLPYSEIARLEQLPVSTVRRRVAAAEQAGSIRFGLVADPALRRLGVQAFLAIATSPRHAGAVAEALRLRPEVERVRTVSGPIAVLAIARFEDTTHLDAAAADVAAGLPDASQLETWPVLVPLRRFGVDARPTADEAAPPFSARH